MGSAPTNVTLYSVSNKCMMEDRYCAREIVVIDFDDTCFPSTWLRGKTNAAHATEDGLRDEWSRVSGTERSIFRQIDFNLQTFFGHLFERKNCDVVILTNAAHLWVEISTRVMLPLTYTAIFQHRHVRVHSARDFVGATHGIENVHLWKQKSLKYALSTSLARLHTKPRWPPRVPKLPHIKAEAKESKEEKSDETLPAPPAVIVGFTDLTEDITAIEAGLMEEDVIDRCMRVYYNYPYEPTLYQVKANTEHMNQIMLNTEWQILAKNKPLSLAPRYNLVIKTMPSAPAPRPFPAEAGMRVIKDVLEKHGELHKLAAAASASPSGTPVPRVPLLNITRPPAIAKPPALKNWDDEDEDEEELEFLARGPTTPPPRGRSICTQTDPVTVIPDAGFGTARSGDRKILVRARRNAAFSGGRGSARGHRARERARARVPASDTKGTTGFPHLASAR